MTTINTRKYVDDQREFPGEVSIKRLEISGVDVRDHWQQIDVFESVYSPTITARITMTETENLIKTIPIIGEEVVHLVVEDDVDEHEHVLRVYKITDRASPTYGTLTYVLHLCTEEMWRDTYVRVSKSYHGAHLEASAESIMRSPDYMATDKPCIFGETENESHVVVPNWSPIMAVSWMANRAVPAERRYHSDFVFYETADGFRWVSMDNLVDSTMNECYGRVTYDPMRPTQSGRTRFDERTPSDVMRLESFRVVESFDTLENARAGMYASRTRLVDVGTRGHVDREHDYVRTFHDGVHLDGMGGVNPRPLCNLGMDMVGKTAAHEKILVKHEGLYDDEVMGNTSPDRWTTSKISRRRQLQNFKIQGSMPGHLAILAGMQLEFSFPNPEKISVNDNPGVDPDYSGKYLVTGLRRMFKRDKFDIVMEMVKDSRGQDPNEVVAAI